MCGPYISAYGCFLLCGKMDSENVTFAKLFHHDKIQIPPVEGGILLSYKIAQLSLKNSIQEIHKMFLKITPHKRIYL